MPATELTAVIILKGLGAVLGAVMSFALVWPKTWRDAIGRLIVAPASGFVFADPVRDLLKFEHTDLNSMAGGVLAALFSWVFFGATIRLAQSVTWGNLPWWGKK